MEKPIVTALLAYGMSGKIFHAPFINTNKDFILHAVLERNQKKASQDYASIISYDDVSTLLSDKKIELIVVNTPNNTHFDYAKKVLLAKKHVLLEKPATSTPEEFIELVALSKKVNKNIFVYQNRRWSSDILATKEVIKTGKLGNIIEVHFRFDRYRPTIGTKLFKENPIPSSGIWYDLGSHLIDQAISLFGKPISNYSYKNKYRQNSKVPDFAFMHIEFKNNVNVFITTSMLVAKPLEAIVIHGTKGSFVKEFCDEQENQLLVGMLPTDKNFGKEKQNKHGKLTYYDDKNQLITKKIPSVRGNFNALFDEIFQSIRHNKPFSIDNEQIIEQIKLLV